MPYLNSVTLMGHLAADIEVRNLASGDAVATFRLGVQNGRSENKNRRGEFFTCDAWGAWAQNLAKTARKGSLVIVEGRLAQDRWIDSRTNEPRYKVKVVASRVFHVAAQYADSHLENARPSGALADGSRDSAPGCEAADEDAFAPADDS